MHPAMTAMLPPHLAAAAAAAAAANLHNQQQQLSHHLAAAQVNFNTINLLAFLNSMAGLVHFVRSTLNSDDEAFILWPSLYLQELDLVSF